MKSLINQYNGINPHLNDVLQDNGISWKEFHDTHIIDMRRLLNQQLVPLGYEARLVSGLQLTTLDLETLNYHPAHPIQPDVLIRRHEKTQPTTAATEHGRANPAVKEYSIPDALMLSEQEYLNALSIVKIDTPNHEIPLAWIELLSPSNKPGGTHHEKYESKCIALLEKGIPLLQIDYLNQTPPVFPILSHYPRDPDSNPYYLAVSDPRPTEEYPEGKVRIFQFAIEESVPTLFIPFRDGKGAEFNFDAAYDETIRTAYAWHIDYEQSPARLQDYSENDRNAIAARMYTVLEADSRGLLSPEQSEALPLACAIQDGPSHLAQIRPFTSSAV